MAFWPVAGAAALAAASYPILNGFVTTFRRLRGLHIVKCPETGDTAAIRLDALRAATSHIVFANPAVTISECSRCSVADSCMKSCVPALVASPEPSLVQNIMSSWYAGKRCFFCDRDMGAIVWNERPHALRRPDGSTVEWTDIRAEQIPAALDTYDPVCWPCHVLEAFRDPVPDRRRFANEAAESHH